MELTEKQKKLLQYFQALKISEENIIGIMLLIQKEEQQNQMMDYIIANKVLTKDQLIEKAMQISQE